MKAFKAVRLAFITSSIVYIFYLVAKGVSKTLRRDVRYYVTYLFLDLKFEKILEYFLSYLNFRISITTIKQEFNTHPYYTFCPEWIDKKFVMEPEEFIKSSNNLYTNLYV